MLKTLTLALAALVAGCSLLWHATHGLRVFTAEGERRASVEREPREIPHVTLVDMTGERFSFPGQDGSPALVEFIYTRCPTICTQLGETFARLTPEVSRRDASAKLISISFDLAHDDNEALAGYAELHGADGKRWTVARPAGPRDLDALIETFGVTVIADGFGGFEHNAAVHLVNRHGQLAGIFGLDEDRAILARTVVE